MKVADAMTRSVEIVPPDATVQAAATVMAEHDIGAVPVGSPEGLVGILTDRDIILRVVVDGRSPAELRVSEVMSRNVFGCRDDDDLDTALQRMREHQVRRLPVYDADERLVGIVALSDLVRARSRGERETVVEALREVAEPHRQTGNGTDR